MTSEVTKYSVYDPRVIQTKPKYAVEKGALSITNVSFNAQTANQSTQQFNVIVPSENVFIDRAVDWISGGVASVLVQFGAAGGTTTGTATAGYTIFGPGDVAVAAFPSHQCVQQMTATINDATVTVNTADVLNYVLRLQDLAQHRKQRTCPTMLDLYGYYPPNSYTQGGQPLYDNSPLNGYGVRYTSDTSPNGAWAQWYFCDATGAPLTTTGGLPVVSTAGASAGSQTVYIRWQSTEKLLLPPFIFGDAFELSTGLFGVQNFQVQMNMLPNPSRAIRISSSVIGKLVASATQAIISVGLPQWVTTGLTSSYAPFPFQPALSVQFMTPALDVPLPPKSIVPYMEFPRYITTGVVSNLVSTLGTTSSTAKSQVTGTQIASNTITLPNIPDLLMIYVKPSVAGATIFGTGTTTANVPYANSAAVWDSTMGDFTLPIQGISINFDNFSGLLANHTQYELYKMSINNGLDMDFNTWCGEGRQASGSAQGTTQTPMTVSLAGGPLVLRPGRDFALQAGQAPGLVGNFTLQFQLTVGNQFTCPVSNLNLYVVPISSGFFETIKGSSRIIKGVLTEQDILSSAAHAPDADLQRMVGMGRDDGMSKTNMVPFAAAFGKSAGKSRMGAYM
jgi:hypothetical protein